MNPSTTPPDAAHAVPSDASQLMERILYEVKRVVVGQDRFLERVLVAMLAQEIGRASCRERVCLAV